MRRTSITNVMFTKWNILDYSIYRLNFLVVKNINFKVKGRAGDLRWVKVRYLNTTSGSVSAYKKNIFKTQSDINYFVTKWGSTSIRTQYQYLTNNSLRFKS